MEQIPGADIITSQKHRYQKDYGAELPHQASHTYIGSDFRPVYLGNKKHKNPCTENGGSHRKAEPESKLPPYQPVYVRRFHSHIPQYLETVGVISSLCKLLKGQFLLSLQILISGSEIESLPEG